MIGQTLGKYRIDAKLGSGGMARVFRARHVHLERQVAVKLLHAHLAEDDALRKRFLHEAQAIASLRHPGIVQIYDFDVDDGVCYIAMEFLKGESLEERAGALGAGGRPPFTVDEALQIIVSVGAALAHAHRAGIVHRDVKPSNVMLTDDGRTVLTDFGLATVLDQTRMTVEGTSAGTPSYMSPEQAMGERGDHRADIYSLGIMAYQLLAGELPFRSETLAGVIHKHLQEPPPPLGHKAPGLAPHIVETIERALAKSPDDRFKSVDEMVAALKGAPISAPLSSAVTEPSMPSVEASLKMDAEMVGATRIAAVGAGSTRRLIGGLAALALAVAAGWWALGDLAGRGATGAAGDADEAAGVSEAVPSMATDAEPKIPSMVPMPPWTDSFDDNHHEWDLSTGPISRALVDGTYEIELRTTSQAVSATAHAGGHFTDVQFSSDATLADGQPESGYGLMFRRVDERNYYVFAVNGLGQWSVWALEKGAWRELRGGPQPWSDHEAIRRDDTNRLSVRAVGNTITVAVNDVELGTLLDDTFDQGYVGYYAASSRSASNPLTRARFDNASVAPLPLAGADASSTVATPPR